MRNSGCGMRIEKNVTGYSLLGKWINAECAQNHVGFWAAMHLTWCIEDCGS